MKRRKAYKIKSRKFTNKKRMIIFYRFFFLQEDYSYGIVEYIKTKYLGSYQLNFVLFKCFLINNLFILFDNFLKDTALSDFLTVN